MGVFCEYMWENVPHYNDTALYVVIHAPLQNNTWFVWIFYYRVWHREGSIPWGIGATSRGPPLAPGSVSRSFRTRSHTPRSEPKIDTLYDPPSLGATSRGPPLAPGSVSRSFRTRSHTPRSEPKIDTLYDPPSLSSLWGPTIVPVGPSERPTCHLLCERW